MVAPAPRSENLADLFATATPLDDPAGSEDLEDLVGFLLAARPAWHADALCQEYPNVDFFPSVGTGTVRAAQQVCARCLVNYECRTWALAQGPDLRGVWAGTSDRGRRAMRSAAGTENARPTLPLLEINQFLAAQPDQDHITQAILTSVPGANARALKLLTEHGYITATTGGIDRRGRYQPRGRFYRHNRPYTASDAALGAAARDTDPSGRSTAA